LGQSKDKTEKEEKQQENPVNFHIALSH